MAEQRRGRGRPPLVENAELQRRALEVLISEGYAETTMTRIAAQSGVSVRTLHRRFATKADIVWGGTEGSLASLRQALTAAADTDDRRPPLKAVAEAIVSVLESTADELTLARTRLRLIAMTPELSTGRPGMYDGWARETAAFLAQHMATSLDDVMARAVGAAVQTTVSQALSWWAANDSEESASAVVRRAMDGLIRAASPRS